MVDSGNNLKNSSNNTSQSRMFDRAFSDDKGLDLSFLKYFLSTFLRRKKYFISAFIFTFLVAIFYTLFQRVNNPIYRGYFTLLISDPILSNSKRVTSTNAPVFDQLLNNNTRNDVPTLIEFLKSPEVLRETAEKFNIKPKYLASKILIKVVDSDRRSFRNPPGALNVTLRYRNPKIGFEILDDLSKNYLNASLEQRQKRLTDGLQFINNEEPALQKNTLLIQRKLSEFQEKYNLIDPTKDALIIKENLSKLDNDIFKLNINRGRLLTIKDKISNGNLTSVGLQIAISDNLTSGSTKEGLQINDANQNILKELINLKAEYAEKITKYLPESAVVSGLRKRINQLEPIVLESQLESVEAAIDLNSALIQTAKKQKEELNLTFLELPKLIAKYDSIRQDLLIALEKRKALVEAKENFQLEIAQGSIPWQILKKPIFFQKPLLPSYRRNLLLGILVSFSAGSLSVYIKDKSDDVYHSPDEVKERLNENLLSHMPNLRVFNNQKFANQSILELLEKFKISKLKGDSNIKNDSERKRLIYENFIYQESLRNLFTSIKFSSADNALEVITLTSCVPQEGKTLINILLANTISDIGKKVLLIDADMRKPQVHKRFALDNILGLSNYLSDPSISYKKVCKEVKQNLTVITSGTIPPDPTRLLVSKRMNKLMEDLKIEEKYDYIIIDAPPILGLSDSLLLADKSDCLILLVSINNVRRDLPQRAVELIKDKNINLLGILTNEVVYNPSPITSAYYGYGGYGGYGYGGYGGYAYANNESNVYLSRYINNDSEELEQEPNKINNEEPKNKRLFTKTKLFLKQKLRYFIEWLNK